MNKERGACRKGYFMRNPSITNRRALRVVPPALLLALAAASLLLTPARADLDAYIRRPEPGYRWQTVTTEKTSAPPAQPLFGGAVTAHELRLTSQEWQGAPWNHRVLIFRPARIVFPDTALIHVTYGSGARERQMGQAMASASGATFVLLSDIPNQPLFEKREDALIAYTFTKFLETGDTSWPLLFPMTKSVVKTMDMVGEWAKKERKTPITRFVVTGASKRGWTTWLTAAVDKRVIGIIPMVYDNLHLARQMPHQLETWGKYSEQIGDYTARGLQAQLATERGRKLSALVDPWAYRDRLTLPKLIINAANDRYWTLDAFNLYRGGLKGPTNVLYAPNAGHSLGGQEMRVIGSSAAWFRRVAAGRPIPTVALKLLETTPRTGVRRLALTASSEAKTARLWVARSASRDFREARWEAVAMRPGSFVADVPPPSDPQMKYAAAFGEIEVEESPLTLYLSSPIVQWSQR